MRDGAPTTEQLRSKIDRGLTSDKVAHPDPAAAPLGADAEAGGAPPTEQERRVAGREGVHPAHPTFGEPVGFRSPVVSLPAALAGAVVFLIVGAFLVSLRLS